MNNIFKKENAKIIAVLIIAICIVGIFVEVVWVYDTYYDVKNGCVPYMSIISLSQYHKDIISSAIRLIILFAVLFYVGKNTRTYNSVVFIIIFRVLRTVMLSLGAFEILFNIYFGYLYSYNLADKIVTGGLAIGFYVLFLAMEGYLIIYRLHVTKDKVQRIFIIELLAIGLMLIYIGLVHIDFNSICIIRYIKLCYMIIVGIIYIVGYFTAIELVVKKLRKKDNKIK